MIGTPATNFRIAPCDARRVQGSGGMVAALGFGPNAIGAACWAGCGGNVVTEGAGVGGWLCEPTALVQSKRPRAGRQPSSGRIEAAGLVPGGRPQVRAKRPRLAPVVSKTRSQKPVLTPKLALS
jgi:hypothetical protein